MPADVLVAVGVIDVLPRCLSSKYFFWDPDLAHLSLGKVSAMKEIHWVLEASKTCPSLKYYYMGYYIHVRMPSSAFHCLANDEFALMEKRKCLPIKRCLQILTRSKIMPVWGSICRGGFETVKGEGYKGSSAAFSCLNQIGS